MMTKWLTRIAIQTLVFAGLLVPASPSLLAQQAASQTPPAGDNSTMNKQDRNDNSPTADQQKENQADLELTRQIREAIVHDKSLSTYAHNVKIIAQNGAVTLKGPVRSEDEKQAIYTKAVTAAGTGKVMNELTVVPEDK